jgi:hypothetical protein
MTIDLYLYNKDFIKPITLIFVKINSKEDENFLENNADYIFKILIENKLALETDILVFNIIKEHEAKIINWILPSIKSNKNLTDKLEKDRLILEKIILETIKNFTCETLITFNNINSDNIEMRVKDCDINLSFLINVYY